MNEDLIPTQDRALPAKKYDAILLASFGGPEGQDDVIPFLRNVTKGRGIPDERLEEVAHHYRAYEGVSPINEQNRQLQQQLQEEFKARGVDLPILWANRNWDPYFVDVFKKAHEDGYKNILAIVTSAYSSYSGCRQYRENFADILEQTGLTGKLTIDKVRQYFDHPGFIKPFIEGTEESVAKMAKACQEKGIDTPIHVMFVTHSIPHADADVSGPGAPIKGPNEDHGTGAYVAQHEAVRDIIIKSIKKPQGVNVEHSLVYQSRSGNPATPWLEPDINDAIAELKDVAGVIVVPIGFVSDHMEVVWDLDNEAKESAEEAGILFDRVATPGISEQFVSGLTDLVLERCAGYENKLKTKAGCSMIPQLGPWFDECSITCCVNQMGELATTNNLATELDKAFIEDAKKSNSKKYA
ncbi:MAG: ferrochelatase [Micrococcaceae bacterium]